MFPSIDVAVSVGWRRGDTQSSAGCELVQARPPFPSQHSDRTRASPSPVNTVTTQSGQTHHQNSEIVKSLPISSQFEGLEGEMNVYIYCEGGGLTGAFPPAETLLPL